MNSTKFATWHRLLCNGYEPDNQIKLTGELSGDGETYIVFEMWGSLTFNDGYSFVSIYRVGSELFRWRKGDEWGDATSFMDAWDKMPTYVTDPDYWEESAMTYHEQLMQMNPDYRPIYYCDFRTSDGYAMANYQPVQFVEKPSHFVTVEGRAFKKNWESGYPANRVVYVEVSASDISSQVSFNE